MEKETFICLLFFAVIAGYGISYGVDKMGLKGVAKWIVTVIFCSVALLAVIACWKICCAPEITSTDTTTNQETEIELNETNVVTVTAISATVIETSPSSHGADEVNVKKETLNLVAVSIQKETQIQQPERNLQIVS